MENSAAKEKGNNMMQGLMLLGGMYEDSRSITISFIWDGVLGFSFGIGSRIESFWLGGLRRQDGVYLSPRGVRKDSAFPLLKQRKYAKVYPRTPGTLQTLNPKPRGTITPCSSCSWAAFLVQCSVQGS